MHLSLYLQDIVSDWLLGTGAPGAPALYLAASSTDPGPDNTTGTFATSRVAFTLGSVQTTEIDGAFALNNAPIVLSGLPGGTYTYLGIFDAATGGNMLMYGPIAVTQAIVNGGSISFAENSLALGMAGGASKYLGEIVVNWLKGTSLPVAPSALKAGLSTTPILRTGLGLTEPVPGYLRANYLPNTPVFVPGTGTKLDASVAMIFGPATASWGVITHVGLFDQTGNVLFQSALPSPLSVPLGAGLSWAIGGMVVTLS